MDVKYPEVAVQLTGADGNAFNLIGIVRRAMKSAGVPAEEIGAFCNEATAGDYDNVLQTCMRWVEVN